MKSGFRVLNILGVFVLVFFSFLWYHSSGFGQQSLHEERRTFDQFLGVNSVREKELDMIQDQYQVANFHRIFAMDSYLFTGEEFVVERKGNKLTVDLSIPHDAYPNDLMGFNPAKGAGKFHFDAFLMRMKENNLKAIPVLARNLLYANVPEDNEINVWQIPYDHGGDPSDPMSYKAYSSFLYQFAARYGKNKFISEGGTVDPKTIKVIDSNEPKAGLDLVYAIEPGNEMDKDWISDKEYMSPERMAAFLSAAIDGHMGQMGPGHGIRTADPAMKIIFPGPIDIKPDYILAVKDNILRMRANARQLGYPINPFENVVITSHIYPFKGGDGQKGEGGDFIENTDIEQKSREFVTKMKEAFDNCEVYLTETGYDKVNNEHSHLGTPVTSTDPVLANLISPYSQAKHISRLVMTMYEVGYDKMFLFTLKDPVFIGDSGYKRKFSTSGLIRKNGEKDHAWYAVNALRSRLAGFELDSTSSINDGNIRVIALRNGENTAYVIWLATNNDALVENYNLDLGDEYQAVKLVQLTDAHPQGEETHLGNEVTSVVLNIDEFPQIVIADN